MCAAIAAASTMINAPSAPPTSIVPQRQRSASQKQQIRQHSARPHSSSAPGRPFSRRRYPSPRTGYAVGPPGVIAESLKVATHTFYAAPTPGQLAGLRALRDGAAWVERARETYRAVGDATAAALGAPAPEGSTFLFLDVRQRLDGRGIAGFLEDCLRDGVALAPGGSSGEAYRDWVRLCYTAAPPDAVKVAVAALARRLS